VATPDDAARGAPAPPGARARAGTRPLAVVLAGGGTGGHTSAGLAIAYALRARLGEEVRLAWIGSRRGVEATWVPRAGLAYHRIPTGKLRRTLSWANATDLTVRVPAGIACALWLLRRLRPDVVVATGGFVAVPTAVAAALRRCPLLVHEQVVVPGLANRLAGRLAARVAVTFAASAGAFPPGKVVVTGNPIRPELHAGEAGRAAARFGLDPTLPLVYVTGGAQGAHRLNRVVGAALGPLLALTQLVHQCGDNVQGDLAWLREQAAALPPAPRARYRPVAFVGEELGDLYAAASLVVGRAGAGTVTELAALGLPAILVPLPGARGDEQTANARVLTDAGAAVLVPERELTPERLADEVRALLADPARRAGMAARARSLAAPDAAERLVELVLALGRPAEAAGAAG
jgi:UDP-N-acetylglucosamine--N-acetylmuramyl-(pentapeptide) pyrophosphoryl-undecaprenol N-acetylglucosamine transferase